MRLIHRLTGLLLFAAMLVIALWFSAPWWLARLAEHQLAGLGFDTLAIGIEEVGFGESSIVQLHIKKHDASLEIRAGHATLSYTIPGLLCLQLESLSLGTLDVAVRPVPQTDAGDGFALLSPAVLFAWVPVRSIEVQHISLRSLDADGRTLRQFGGQAGYADKALYVSLGEADAQGVQAMLSLNASGDCGAQLSHAGLDTLRMDCHVSQTASGMALQGDLQADLARLDELLAVRLSMPEHRLAGNIKATWKADLPTAGMQHMRIESVFDVEADMHALRVSLKGRVGYADGAGEWAIADDSLLRFGNRLRSGISFAGLTGGFSAGDSPGFTLNSGGMLQLKNLSFGEGKLPQLDVSLQSALQIAFTDDLILSRPADIAIHMRRMDWGRNKLSTRAIGLHLKAGKMLSPAAALEANGLMLETDGLMLPVGSLNADMQFDAGTLTGKGGFVANDHLLKLDWNLRHSVAKRAGQLRFSAAPLIFPAAEPLLQQFVNKQDGLLLQSGSLTASGRLAWGGKGLTAAIPLHLGMIKGAYKGYTFSGLNADVQAGLDAASLRLNSDNITAQMLDTGLPLTDIGMRAKLIYPFKAKPKVVLRDVRAEGLGGHVSSEVIDIDTARPGNPFVVRLEHVDVKHLVEFRKQEGLFAEGLLDGTLPFDWTDKGLRMLAGSLDARIPGGLIRYLGTASMQQMAASDKVLGMAMQVLSDFHFKVLHTQVDYQPDGQLTLHLELKGNNPAYENGRPIELNLNIEENVLKLLQSLRAADEIGERVEKSVKKRMQE